MSLIFLSNWSFTFLVCSEVDLSAWPKTTETYHKIPKFGHPKKCCNHPKIRTRWLYHRIMCPKSEDVMANSAYPDQTAPVEAVWSGSTLFAHTWLFVCLCWGLTSQSTIFQSCRDGATASWVINQYFRGVKCLAQGHNTAAVGIEPPNLSLRSPTLYHWATALPSIPVWKLRITTVKGMEGN